MPDTTLGITYPASTDHNRMWEHLQELATDVDTLIAADRTKRDPTWTTYTPTITGSTSGTATMSSSTVEGRYLRQGRLVHGWIDITLAGSPSITGSTSGSLLFSLPPVAAVSTALRSCGTGTIIDASPSARYACTALLNSTTNIFLVRCDTGATITNTTITYAAGDILTLEFKYLAGSAP